MEVVKPRPLAPHARPLSWGGGPDLYPAALLAAPKLSILAPGKPCQAAPRGKLRGIGEDSKHGFCSRAPAPLLRLVRLLLSYPFAVSRANCLDGIY
jgi:hypothetical protein